MSASTCEAALAHVFAHEGGYTNHPSDPGGPTNFGITISDYRRYVKAGATAEDVRRMPIEEARRIYRARYWDALACDDLPAGVDYAVFDYGVNSGIGRSGKVLRRALHLPDDTSVVTGAVIAAARAADARTLIAAICDERLRFLRSLKTWDVFGKGWARRVAEVKADALALAEPAPVRNAASDTEDKRGPTLEARHAASGATLAAAVLAAFQTSRTGIAIAVLAAGIAGALAFHLLWKRKGSSMGDRIKAWFRHSVTILWARMMALGGLLLASVQALASDPNVSSAVQTVLQPKFIPYYVIAIGLVTELARRRTAGKAG